MKRSAGVILGTRDRDDPIILSKSGWQI